MKIQKFLSSLPQPVLKGEDILVPDTVIRKLFNFAQLNKFDIFYHLGCGKNNTVAMAAREFKVRKSVGIEIRKKMAAEAKKKIAGIKSAEVIIEDIKNVCISDATVILFWFTDDRLVRMMLKKFEKELKNNARLITIWSPPDLLLPSRVDFPFILCHKPFKYARSISEQIRAIYGNPCIDFTASWLLADRYIRQLETVAPEHHRFVNMLQSMVIWINAWNIGVACEDKIPPPVEAYIGILKTFYNIDISSMIKKVFVKS